MRIYFVPVYFVLLIDYSNDSYADVIMPKCCLLDASVALLKRIVMRGYHRKFAIDIIQSNLSYSFGGVELGKIFPKTVPVVEKGQNLIYGFRVIWVKVTIAS